MTPRAASLKLPDRFVVARHVADGGMASVWAADDRLLGRTVAIKLLAERFLGDRDAVARFEREARAAAKVSGHPHVVTIFDVGEHGGRPFIVMEMLDGGSLAEQVRRRPLPGHADALRWLAETAQALDYAHKRGIVHRDVKPANLLLDERGRLGVADFGIARVAFAATVTATGQVLGTAAYLSPEQASGDPAGPASDRYALAVVAYELLTGERPFAGGNPAAQALQHIEAEPVPPSARAGGRLAPEVDRVLLRGLAKDPGERWPSAGELVEALERAVGGEVPTPDATAAFDATSATQALPPAGEARSETATGLRTPPAPGAGTRTRPARRRSRHAPLFALGAGFAATLAVLALASPGGEDSAQRAGQETQAPRTGAATPPATAARTATQPSADSGESVTALNDRGFALIDEGRFDEAIPPLQDAVRKCGESTELPCAYAMFNLGHALRRAGRPAEAIPILERRLQIPNQRDEVRRELEAAQREAGQEGGSDNAERNDERAGRGRGRDKEKRRSDGEGEGEGDD